MGAIARAAVAYVLVSSLVRLWTRVSGRAPLVPATATTSAEWLVLALAAGVALAGLAGAPLALAELALGAVALLCVHRLHAWLAHRALLDDE